MNKPKRPSMRKAINDLQPIINRAAFNGYVAKRELRQFAGELKRQITRSYKRKLRELEKSDE